MSRIPAPDPGAEVEGYRIAGSFARLGGASVISTAAQLIRAKLAALFLNPAGVGAFNQFGLLWNLICLAGSLSITNGIIYHTAKHRRDGNAALLARLVSSAFILTLFATVLISLAGFIFSAEISKIVFGPGNDHSIFVRLGFLFAPMGVALALSRAFLSGFKDSSCLARSQVIGDLIGTIIFAFAVVIAGLTGSILAFLANQAIVLIVAWRGMAKHLGRSAIPRRDRVDVAVLRENSGFSVSNFILIGVSNLTLLAVSTAIIAADGLAQNGLFMSGFRIAGILLTAITATTINYVLPLLSETNDDRDHSDRVDATLQFYFLVATPPMALLILFGPFVIPLLLSKEFLPAAVILAFLVPAELARVSAETLGISLLARKRLVAYSSPFLLYAALFTVLTIILVGPFGILGVSAAYLIGQIVHLIVAGTLKRVLLGTFMSFPTALLGLASLAILFVAGINHLLAVDRSVQILLLALCLVAWLACAIVNPAVRGLRSIRRREAR